MATRDLAAARDALEQFVLEHQVQQQANRSALLPNILEKRPGKGKNASGDVELGTDTGMDLTDGQDILNGDFKDDPSKMAIWDWGISGDPFKVTSLAESAAAASDTEHAQTFLLKTRQSGQRLISTMSARTYNGSGTQPQIHGLTATAGPLEATGTYAGIDRGVFPLWASNVLGNGGVLREIEFGLMHQMFTDIYTASGVTPDLIMCSPSVWASYGEQFKGDRRYVKSIEVRGQEIRLSGGWEALDFNGVPVIRDKDCPTNSMLFLNLEHVYYRVLPPSPRVGQEDLINVPIAGTQEEQMSRGRVPGRMPMMARLRKLAASGDYCAYLLIAFWYALCVDRPNSCGILNDVR